MADRISSELKTLLIQQPIQAPLILQRTVNVINSNATRQVEIAGNVTNWGTCVQKLLNFQPSDRGQFYMTTWQLTVRDQARDFVIGNPDGLWPTIDVFPGSIMEIFMQAPNGETPVEFKGFLSKPFFDGNDRFTLTARHVFGLANQREWARADRIGGRLWQVTGP